MMLIACGRGNWWPMVENRTFYADVAQQFQYAVRVIGSNFAPTVERDEFLVAEKIKKERTVVSGFRLVVFHPSGSWLVVFHPSGSWLVVLPSGSWLVVFHPSGSWLVVFHPSGSWLVVLPSGSWLVVFPSGSWLVVLPSGSWLVVLPSGQFVTCVVMVPLPGTSFAVFLLLSLPPNPSFLVQRGGLIPISKQGVLKNKWSILYLLLSLSEDPRRPPSKVSSYATLFAQALPRDAHSTPYYYARPQTLPLSYQDRSAQSAQSSGSVGSSGISSIGLCALSGPAPAPQSLLPGQSHPAPGVGDCLRQQLGSRLAWTLTANQPSSQATTSKGVPNAVSRNMTRSRREGDTGCTMEITEAALVRDILYVFQGIDGKNIKMNNTENCYKVEGKANLSRSLRDTAVRLSELGWLHNKIRRYTDQRSLDRSFGLVGQPGRKGGELASAVHAYTKTGDPYMRSLVQHILSLVSHPVLSFLYRWIYDGELEDTYHEFFVASDPTVKTDRLWHDKYTLRKSMIPSFITMDQSRKVLLIGKSINFLHQVCHDQTPTTKMIAVTKSAESPQDAADLFTDLENAFQGKIDAAYFETSKYLLDVLNKKYSLLDHMQAMRRYLLLGQGDFIRHLMDLLKPELVRPATTLYQHNLTGILETAVRATNAQFDSPEILRRLDVRLLEVSPGDTGWDVFSLDYHVDGPIATVFTRECMSHYLRVFNFLWRAKRMEYILTDIRKGHMCNAKLLRNMPEFSGVLHQCHVLASEMVHFIHQMQYYITFEVLECSWDELWNKVQQAQDLDHIIAAHEVFLDTIISRCLLDGDSRALLNQLRAVFDQIIELQNAQDAIYRAALEELQRRLQFEEKKKQREIEGQWGVTAAEEEEENKRIGEFKESIPKMCSQLRILTHFYQGIVQQFLVLLTTSSDESLRFLSFRLDFNEHYKAREPRLRVSLGTRGRRSSHT
ncbi:PREDICTED: gamma-tubulin complex component 3 [Mandrillus leucophaeus]|uniref:gamma-tubulin complex component 3 n=1 Tax=Mandrillus leucophaeus TaxID=9568 RepID=UPI0005F54250|nr:PREDICTED: gamma-tubulin complex component 3 [Mandrillus leucophaeus]